MIYDIQLEGIFQVVDRGYDVIRDNIWPEPHYLTIRVTTNESDIVASLSLFLSQSHSLSFSHTLTLSPLYLSISIYLPISLAPSFSVFLSLSQTHIVINLSVQLISNHKYFPKYFVPLRKLSKPQKFYILEHS